MASVIPTSFEPMRWGLGVQGRAELGGLEGRGLSDPLITLSPPLIPPYLAPRPLSTGIPTFPLLPSLPTPFSSHPTHPSLVSRVPQSPSYPIFVTPSLPSPDSTPPFSPPPSPVPPSFPAGLAISPPPRPPISISPSQRCSAAAFRTRCLAPWQPPRAAPRALRWRRPAETSSRGSRCRS